MIILGIETSCDETAASILKIENGKLEIVSNVVASQVDIHRKYGGIVPEVAARAHCEKILPVLQECLANPHKSTTNFSNSLISTNIPQISRINISGISGKLVNIRDDIDLIAVTNGPGLITSLLVGAETAKTLSYLWQKPLLPINHLIGHIYAVFLNSQLSVINDRSLFPAICLVVSGGHTELILMPAYEKFKKIGQTLDDAAGECFDKVAKLLNIGYPGGPIVAKMATKIKNQKSKIKNIELPRPMIKTNDYNFSFSGLKTAVLYKVKEFKPQLSGGKSEIKKKMKQLPQTLRSERKQFIAAVCAEVQQAIIDVLIIKTIRAVRNFNAKTVILCGGVAANEELRKNLELKTKNLKLNFLVPPKNLCTDNAAMIAAAAYFRWQKLTPSQQKDAKNNWQKIKVEPGMEI